jgi:hypothetical protein
MAHKYVIDLRIRDFSIEALFHCYCDATRPQQFFQEWNMIIVVIGILKFLPGSLG